MEVFKIKDIFKKVISLLVIVFILVGYLPFNKNLAKAAEKTANIYAEMDTFFDKDTYYGNGVPSPIPNYNTNWVGAAESFGEQRSLIKFDLSTITRPIASAKLILYIGAFNGNPIININTYNEAWDENTNVPPASPTPQNRLYVGNIPTALGPGGYIIQKSEFTSELLTNYVKTQKAVGGKVSFLLTGSTTPGNEFEYVCDDNINPDGSYNQYCPQLEITYAGSYLSSNTTINEENADANFITISLAGYEFADAILDKNNFQLVNAPSGLTIESVEFKSTTSCQVNLAYDGTDIDSNYPNLTVNIMRSEIRNGTSDLPSSNNLEISATNDSEALEVATSGDIYEGNEAGKKLTVKITGGTFPLDLNTSNWEVKNLPTGVTVDSYFRVSNKLVEITLKGNSLVDYDSDINLQVVCKANGYNDSSGNDISAIGAVIHANKAPSVETSSPATNITYTSAVLNGNVTSNGNLPLLAKGFEYKKSSDLAYTSVSHSDLLTGAYNFTIGALASNTSYDFKAFATNAEGTSYGSLVTFSTPRRILKVTYNGNGSTGGTIPIDTMDYDENTTATIRGNVDLVKAGYVFGGWSANPEGTGRVYKAEDLVVLGIQSLNLYARWLKTGLTVDVSAINGNAVRNPEKTSYIKGDVVELTATANPGYNFIGWYDSTNTKVSSNSVWEIMVSENASYTAKFEAISIEGLTVNIEGAGSVTGWVSGETKNYPIGTTVVITAMDDVNNPFMYWKDSGGRVVSTNKSFSIRLGYSETLTAAFGMKEATKHLITFKNGYGEIIKSEFVTEGQTVVFPNPPSMLGYNSTGWDKTDDDIINTKVDLVVTPTYTKLPDKMTITIINGTGSGSFDPREYITIVAALPEVGMKFSHWKDSNNNIICYEETYKFYVTKSETYTAVYISVDNVVEQVASIVITSITQKDGKVSFTAERIIPEGCTIISHGIIATKNMTIGTDATSFVIGGADVIKGTAKTTGLLGVCVYNVPAIAGETCYARGYVIYRDTKGNILTIYSNIASGTKS